MTRLFLPSFSSPMFLDPVSGLLEANRAARLKLLSPASRAGIKPGDVLLRIDQKLVHHPSDVAESLHASTSGSRLDYVVVRQEQSELLAVPVAGIPSGTHWLYLALAGVGIFTLVVGAMVRLRRPHNQATLHFFWLTVAFFGVLAFTPSGRYDRLDYFFDWADLVAVLLLPPLFLHFALVFPERPDAWVATRSGRALLAAVYLPALFAGARSASARRCSAVRNGDCSWPRRIGLEQAPSWSTSQSACWRDSCS